MKEIDWRSVVVVFDKHDYPDLVDAYAAEAYWSDGSMLNGEELLIMNEIHAEEIQQLAREQSFGE